MDKNIKLANGIRISDKEITQCSEKVGNELEGKMKYMSSIIKGLYSGDMNQNEDFKVFQEKTVSSIIQQHIEETTKKIKSVMEKELIRITHQVTGQVALIQKASSSISDKSIISKTDTSYSSEEDIIKINLDFDKDNRNIVEFKDNRGAENISVEKLKKDIDKRMNKYKKKEVNQKGSDMESHRGEVGPNTVSNSELKKMQESGSHKSKKKTTKKPTNKKRTTKKTLKKNDQ